MSLIVSKSGLHSLSHKSRKLRIRTIALPLITAREPWFLAKPVCDALDTQTDNLRGILDEKEAAESNIHCMYVGTSTEHTEGTKYLIISESGLHSLVIKSRKPEARFQAVGYSRDAQASINTLAREYLWNLGLKMCKMATPDGPAISG